MELARLERTSDYAWRLPAAGGMRVPAMIFASRAPVGCMAGAELADRGLLVRSPSGRGLAEEAPGASKDVEAVALASAWAGLARRVARLEPLSVVKG